MPTLLIKCLFRIVLKFARSTILTNMSIRWRYITIISNFVISPLIRDIMYIWSYIFQGQISKVPWIILPISFLNPLKESSTTRRTRESLKLSCTIASLCNRVPGLPIRTFGVSASPSAPWISKFIDACSVWGLLTQLTKFGKY